MKHRWTVYTASALNVDTTGLGNYQLIATTWTDEGPDEEGRRIMGQLSGVTKEQADEAAAVAQRSYDQVRNVTAPKA